MRTSPLLAGVTSQLDAAGITHALIGAAALAAHGISRSTFDVDLLVVDPRCLTASLWAALGERGIAAEIRRGDADDPLAGVVRFTAAGEPPVDLIVGRFSWQRDTLTRAGRTKLGGLDLAVLRPADLVLLKLYAGGPQDAWDIQQLLAVSECDTLAAEVEARLGALPPHAAALWHRIRETDPPSPR